MLASSSSTNSVQAQQLAVQAAPALAAAPANYPLSFDFEIRLPGPRGDLLPLGPASTGAERFGSATVTAAGQPLVHALLGEFAELIRNAPPNVAHIFLELFPLHEIELLASNPHIFEAFELQRGRFADVLAAARSLPARDIRMERSLDQARAEGTPRALLVAALHPSVDAEYVRVLSTMPVDPQADDSFSKLCCGLLSCLCLMCAVPFGYGMHNANAQKDYLAGVLYTTPVVIFSLCALRLLYAVCTRPLLGSEMIQATRARAIVNVDAALADRNRSEDITAGLALNRFRRLDNESESDPAPEVVLHVDPLEIHASVQAVEITTVAPGPQGHSIQIDDPDQPHPA